MCNWLVGFGSEQLKESFALIIWGSNSLQAHGHPTLISVQVGAEALGHGDREQGMAALQSPNHVLPRAESVPSEAHGNTGTGALPVSCAGTDTAKGSLPSLWGKNVPKSFSCSEGEDLFSAALPAGWRFPRTGSDFAVLGVGVGKKSAGTGCSDISAQPYLRRDPYGTLGCETIKKKPKKITQHVGQCAEDLRSGQRCLQRCSHTNNADCTPKTPKARPQIPHLNWSWLPTGVTTRLRG